MTTIVIEVDDNDRVVRVVAQDGDAIDLASGQLLAAARVLAVLARRERDRVASLEEAAP